MDRGRVPQLPDWTDGVPPGVTVELLRIQKPSTTSFDVSNSPPVGCIFGHEKHDATLMRTHEAQLDGNDHGGSSSVQWLLGGHRCGNMPGLGARASAGRTKTTQKEPVYGVSGGDTHSLAASSNGRCRRPVPWVWLLALRYSSGARTLRWLNWASSDSESKSSAAPTSKDRACVATQGTRPSWGSEEASRTSAAIPQRSVSSRSSTSFHVGRGAAFYCIDVGSPRMMLYEL